MQQCKMMKWLRRKYSFGCWRLGVSVSVGVVKERERERGSDRSQRKGREQINKPNRIEKVSVGKKGVLWTFLSEHDLEEERSGGI